MLNLLALPLALTLVGAPQNPGQKGVHYLLHFEDEKGPISLPHFAGSLKQCYNIAQAELEQIILTLRDSSLEDELSFVCEPEEAV